jgi:hypothetical protein
MAAEIPVRQEDDRDYVLPLARARLCLDCEILTVRQVCPKCDKSRTFSVNWWIRPVKEGEVKHE